MNQKHSGSILAPLIFAICLLIFPRAVGFFLALFVLLVINLAMNEREQAHAPRYPVQTRQQPSPKPSHDSREIIVYFILVAAFFGFMFLLAKSETLFKAVSGLFAFVVVVGVTALVVLVLWGLFTSARNRPGLSIVSATVAVALTVSLFTNNHPSVEQAIECSAAWLCTCLLVRLFFRMRKETSSFLFILAKNLTQFVLVFLVVAVVAAFLPVMFRHTPLPRILTWRGHLEALHKLLEKLQLSSSVALGIVVALLIVRRRFPQWSTGNKLEKLWGIWDKGSDGLKRIALVLTALFCFGFTGHLEGNVAQVLQSSIKDFDKTYDKLVWQVYLDVSAELNIRIYGTSFEKLPQETKHLIQAEIDANKKADAIPSGYFTSQPATIIPEVLADDVERDIRAQKDSIESTKASWLPSTRPASEASLRVLAPAEATPEQVDAASQEAGNGPSERKTPEWMRGIGGKAIDKFLEFVLDSDHMEFIRNLKETYPVGGEFLDVISKSIQEQISNKLEKVAERIAEKRMKDHALRIQSLVGEEVSSLNIDLDMSQITSRLHAQESLSQVRESKVQTADKRFERNLKSSIAEALGELHARREELQGAQLATGKRAVKTVAEKEMPINLESLREINERKASYEEQLAEIMRHAPPLERKTLRWFLGPERYEQIQFAYGIPEHDRESAKVSTSTGYGNNLEPGKGSTEPCCDVVKSQPDVFDFNPATKPKPREHPRVEPPSRPPVQSAPHVQRPPLVK